MTDRHQMAVDAVRYADELEDDRRGTHEMSPRRPHKRTLDEMRASVSQRIKELAAEKSSADALADKDDLEDGQDPEEPLSADILVSAVGASRDDDLYRVDERVRRGDDVDADDVVDAALGRRRRTPDMRKVSFVDAAMRRTEGEG